MKRQLGTPVVLIFIAIAVSGVIAASLLYSASREKAIANLSKEVGGELRVFSGLVNASTEKYEYLPRIVSEYSSVSAALADPESSRKILQANLLLERLKSESGASDIFLMDGRGNTIASSNWNREDSFVGNNYAFRPYFYNAINKGKGRFYAVGIITGVPGYYLSHRITKNNATLGVAVVKVNISSLPISWESRSMEILVSDETDIIFLSSRPDWQYRPMWKMSAGVQRDLEFTRKYGGELKTEAPFDVNDIRSESERIVDLSTERRWYGHGGPGYFLKSYVLPGSDWTVHAIAPMNAINAHARMTAYIALGSAAILELMLLGLNQYSVRGRERRKHLQELERAHRNLEKKNKELQALNAELHLQSTTDSLTGVFNRRHFLKQVDQILSFCSRHGYPFSIVMIDIDHFKQINDTHGHPCGDAVLKAVVGLLKSALRESDILARWGGEEFVIALPHADEQEAALVAERIREKVMENTISVDSKSIAITVSSGVAQNCREESGVDDAIKRADEALYEAKRDGRNRVCVASRLAV